MSDDEIAKVLHDRATRGETLSADEQAQLEAWYARQGAEEIALLAGAPSPGNLDALRTQVDEARSQLLAVSERIRAQAAENQRLRREIAELERRLAS
jgi:septal ring factor EnvC (AmiA/AmiB activator)